MALTKVTSGGLTDDSIVNADINSSAAVALSKLATDPSNASNLASGTVPTARLGSGTASASTFLTGAQTYAGAGITMAEQWRIHTTFTGDSDPIASNWEQADTDGAADLGSSLTESSGVFTFPSTGMWLIMATFNMNLSGSNRSSYSGIDTTTNNATYSTAASGTQGFAQSESGITFGACSCNFFFDVTDTTQCKFRLIQYVNNDSTSTLGSSAVQDTGFTVVRLGDT